MSGIKDPKVLSMMVFLIFGILALWSFVTQETTFGRIYSSIFYLTLGVIALSYIMPKVFEYQPVDSRNIKLQLLAGFALGFALAGGLFVQNFSFLAPLSIPDIALLGVLGFSAVGQVFIMSVAVSEFEEALRSATLRPSFAEWLQFREGVSVLLLLIGSIVYFTADSFDPALKIVGLILAFVGVLNFTRRFIIADRIKGKWTRFMVANFITAAFFAILHFTAYATGNAAATQSLLLNAFMYALIADTINTYFESTAPSRVAHTLNNAAVSCVAVGIPVLFALIVAAVHALIIFVTATGEFPGRGKR